MEDLEKRLIALEEKFLHQDRLVTELNAMVAKQAQNIDGLIAYIQESEGSKGTTKGLTVENLKDEVPPHY